MQIQAGMQREAGTLVVTPEHLYAKAEEWEKVIEQMKEALCGLEEAFEATKGSLEGMTGDRMRSVLKRKKKRGEFLLKDLKKVTEGLKETAAEYERTEKRNKLA